ncbi:8504_t:CDS:2, partial [Paraglomus occultum]
DSFVTDISGSSLSSRYSYGLKDLPSSASKFVKEDMDALNATFIPATDENDVIPNVRATNFPYTYLLPDIGRDILDSATFDVDMIRISDGHVKSFIHKLHKVVRNAGLDIGTEESKTDSLVNHLLCRTIDFDNWPLDVELKESYKLSVSDINVRAVTEFAIEKKNVAMTIVEDKHLKNVKAMTDFGEAQMLAEILAAEISKAYLQELCRGLPKTQSVVIRRWPGQNGLRSGFDLAQPDGRQAVLTALTKIHQFLLQ